MPEEQIQNCDTLINLTGRRVTIVLPDKTRLDIEPSPGVARVTWPEREQVGVLQFGKLAIPMYSTGLPVLSGLPRPRAGIAYIVKYDVARHPLVRRRSDVLFPNSVPSQSSVSAAIIVDGLTRE